jgi:hypothetical protein
LKAAFAINEGGIGLRSTQHGKPLTRSCVETGEKVYQDFTLTATGARRRTARVRVPTTSSRAWSASAMRLADRQVQASPSHDQRRARAELLRALRPRSFTGHDQPRT